MLTGGADLNPGALAFDATGNHEVRDAWSHVGATIRSGITGTRRIDALHIQIEEVFATSRSKYEHVRRRIRRLLLALAFATTAGCAGDPGLSNAAAPSMGGVPTDVAQAKKLLRKACDAGSKDACSNLHELEP